MWHIWGREIHTEFWLENLKRLPGRPRHRWDDNTKMFLEE
jgi:hypothetical protein